MINCRIKYTYRDYINLPESETDLYELIDGELYMVPAPTPMHQTVSGNVYSAMRDFVSRRDLGAVFYSPIDVVLSDHDVVQPDIIFISKDRLGIVTERNVRGAPDLVIEILSPSTAERDRTIKRARYLRFGVREYWLVDIQAKSIEVLKAGQDEFETVRVYTQGSVLVSPVLEGFGMEIQSVFA